MKTGKRTVRATLGGRVSSFTLKDRLSSSLKLYTGAMKLSNSKLRAPSSIAPWHRVAGSVGCRLVYLRDGICDEGEHGGGDEEKAEN